MEPTAATWAVLGLVALPRSGYDIKRIVDRSIRHFWAASYGQIYPELKRLEEAAGSTATTSRGAGARGGSTGSRRRQRGAARLAAGRETRVELRDESLLRLFFADTFPRDHALGLLAARREGYRADARVPARPRRRHRARSAVRRPRLPLGPRLLRVGDRMVRPTGAPPASGGVRSSRSRPGGSCSPAGCRRSPWRVRAGRLFYGVWRTVGSAGDRASTVVPHAAACCGGAGHGRRARRGRGVHRHPGARGLAADSATVYLAQPVLVSACWGAAYLVSAAIGRPLIGAFARVVPVPAGVPGQAVPSRVRHAVGRVGRLLPRCRAAAVALLTAAWAPSWSCHSRSAHHCCCARRLVHLARAPDVPAARVGSGSGLSSRAIPLVPTARLF